MISSSVEWNSVRENYVQQLSQLPYNEDLRKLLTNIDMMVITLSKSEVISRRKHKSPTESDELRKTNDAIKNLERWIIMASLLC